MANKQDEMLWYSGETEEQFTKSPEAIYKKLNTSRAV